MSKKVWTEEYSRDEVLEEFKAFYGNSEETDRITENMYNPEINMQWNSNGGINVIISENMNPENEEEDADYV